MQHPDYDFMVVMERRRDELADAEQSRLIKEARAAKRTNAGLRYARLGRLRESLALSLAQFLLRIGGWMVDMSCRMKNHYEMLREGVTEKSPSPCHGSTA